MNSQKYIIKASGQKEIFNHKKLEDSLMRAGAHHKLAEEITFKIESEIKDGDHTGKIYEKAFSLLAKKDESLSAVKYSIRRSIIDLGPNGFPFEDYVGEIFRAKGYKVDIGQTIKGFCVIHEVDLIAQNDREFIISEIKFHNSTGVKSDLKTALYVKARFDDLEQGGYYHGEVGNRVHRKILITNTKFSTRAAQYAACAGFELIGWNYPSKGNLQDLVHETRLHPLTSLTTLSQKEKQTFLNQGIVLCKDLEAGGENLLKANNVKDNKIPGVMEEIIKVCAM